MGKMPAGLARYWAKRRRTGRKVIRKTRTVMKTARRRYFGRKGGRGGKVRIPLVPALAVAGLGISMLSNKGSYPNSPIGYMVAGSYDSAATAAAANLVKPANYIAPMGILILGGVARLVFGKVPLGKRVSVF